MIWALLTSRLAGPAMAATAVVAGLAVGAQTIRLGEAINRAKRAETVVVRLSDDLAACRATARTLDVEIARQNSRVAGLEREAATRVAQSARAVSAAKSEAARLRQRAARMLTTTDADPDRCAAADRLILEAVK